MAGKTTGPMLSKTPTIIVRTPKGMKEEIQTIITEQGVSANTYVVDAIALKMALDGKPQRIEDGWAIYETGDHTIAVPEKNKSGDEDGHTAAIQED